MSNRTYTLDEIEFELVAGLNPPKPPVDLSRIYVNLNQLRCIVLPVTPDMYDEP
jgi:hypothetical protein